MIGELDDQSSFPVFRNTVYAFSALTLADVSQAADAVSSRLPPSTAVSSGMFQTFRSSRIFSVNVVSYYVSRRLRRMQYLVSGAGATMWTNPHGVQQRARKGR